ncbi:MAG: hypothetical protein WA154_04015 [Moraxellaceae bacterium]
MTQIQPLFQHQWTRRLLVVAMSAAMSSQVLALQAISDDEMAEATGEGIAFLPESFSMRFNGADDTPSAGHIRLIPVGPLTPTAIASGYEKADIYLYGLSLSQSNQDYGLARTGADWGAPFGRPITSWGTADNPWLLKVETDPNVPNFAGVSNQVSFLELEAPLYRQTPPTAGSAESSAYNLKMGLWADAFMRDAATPENGYDGLSNRLRLSAVWDGFSINGSNLKIFQTLDGVTAANLNQGLSTSYNQTFGMAGLIRLNGGDTQVTRNGLGQFTGGYGAQVVRSAPTLVTPANTNNLPNNSPLVTLTYQPLARPEDGGNYPLANNFNNGDQGRICGTPENGTESAGNANNPGHCLTREGFRNITFSASGTNSWTPPAAKSVLRISTQQFDGSMFGDGTTPALGGPSPNFGPNAPSAEGIFLYGLNVNLVLGSLYQPLVLSSDGANFSMELARIPNNPNVYQRIYQDYSTPSSTTFLGSTCNVYQCGRHPAGTKPEISSNYQASTATHSSISIGSTVYDPATNRLSAYKGIESFGVSFGELQSGTGLASSRSETYKQVFQATRGTSGGNWGAWGNWTQIAETRFNQNSSGQILGIDTNVPVPYTNTLTVPGATVSNNFGSAVIDGLLIQHMKFTTTGLN